MAPHVVLGDVLHQSGRFGEARVCFEKALAVDPSNALIHFKIATTYWSEGARDAACRALQEAVSLDPKLACAHEWLGQWYLQEGMGAPAFEHSRIAVTLMPTDASALASHAFVLEAAGELDRAWALLGSLLAANYTPARVATLYARLAPLYRRQSQALELVERLLANTTAPTDLKSLHFAAAELLDRLGRYDQAFVHAEQANHLGRQNWDAAKCSADVERLINYFTSERLRHLTRAQNRSDQPVFIVGMPRSGTSLVEQIISSHPQAYGAGELDFIHRIQTGAIDMLGATDAQFPECLEHLSIEQAQGLSEVYIEPLRAMAPGALRLTDKMPLNFMHLGLISLLLPGARIIHCRRDPLDTCLSCYMTPFTAGHEFATDLNHLGAFYQIYSRLMEHWKKVLPLPILELSYEELVLKPKKQIRGLVEFLGLRWNRKCMRFRENRRFITTASVAQVRQPVYTSSIGRWRKYERHLAPLQTALGLKSISTLPP